MATYGNGRRLEEASDWELVFVLHLLVFHSLNATMVTKEIVRELRYRQEKRNEPF